MHQTQRSLKVLASVSVALIVAGCCQSVQAQVTPDSTLGAESSTVTPHVTINGLPSDRIDGGAVRGANLFHSFREFNIDSGRGVYFFNPAGISNILTRITGGNPSQIKGTLGVLGNANLFLINPNGISFGPNARLDLRGSFLASTANSLIFDNGFEFSATEPAAPPLLTVNIPVGLRFRENPGSINVLGTGASLKIQDPIFTPIQADNSNSGLRVAPGSTLALIGGNVSVEGGILTSPAGRIELGAVGGGTVSLSPAPDGMTLGYEGVQNFGDIQLSGQSLADASGDKGGSVQVLARNLRLRDGSAILIQNRGELPAGDIAVSASESIELSGNSGDGTIFSNLFNQTLGNGAGGDIALAAKRLTLQNGARVMAQSFGAGASGHLSVSTSEEVKVQGFLPANPQRTSVLGSYSIGSGNAGNVAVSTGRLRVLEGGTVGSITFGTGAGGNAAIAASDSIEITGAASISSSVVTASTFNAGNAGNLTIKTGRLVMRDGGRAIAATYATGDAGSLSVSAAESIEAIGTMPAQGDPTQLGASAIVPNQAFQESFKLAIAPTGNAGRVTVDTPVLKVSDSAQVTVRNDGSGSGGKLEVNADSIFLNNFGGITAFTRSGSAGNIELNARTVELNNGSINAFTRGAGKGGDITIRASESVDVIGGGLAQLENLRDLAIARKASLSDFNFGIANGTSGEGTAGDIRIETGRLSLRNGGLIAAPTVGSGAGGHLFLSASESVEVVSSIVAAPTFGAGMGGNIDIETRRFAAREGGQFLTTTYGSGKAGNITVRASDSIEVAGRSADNVLLSGLYSDVAENASGEGGNLMLETRRLSVANGQVSANTAGSGNAGFVSVRAADSIDLTDSDNNFISESGLYSAVEPGATGKAGNMAVETARLRVLDGAQISVATYGAGDAGSLTVRAADSIEVDGTRAENPNDSLKGEFSALYAVAASSSTGNAGSMLVETGRLLMRNGGEIAVGTFSSGNAGELILRAAENIEVSGTAVTGFPAAIYTDTLGAGNGGSMRIETPHLIVRGGAQISAGTFSTGLGGNVTINATDSVELTGSAPATPDAPYFTDDSGTRFPSGLFASAEQSGVAGALRIETGRLIVSDGAVISVSSSEIGAAGNLNVAARSIRLNGGTLSAETVQGDKANITLTARDIQMRRGSSITTNSTGGATGGNITINTQTLASIENSDISANSVSSRGGQVSVNASGVFGTQFRFRQTPKSDITATSELGASFSGTVEIKTPDLDPSAGLVQLPETVIDLAGLIGENPCSLGSRSKFTITGRGGLPPNPAETLSPSATVVEWATQEDRSEELEVRSEELKESTFHSVSSSTPHSTLHTSRSRTVPARGWAFNDKGEVVLTAYNSSGTAPQRLYPAPPSCQQP